MALRLPLHKSNNKYIKHQEVKIRPLQKEVDKRPPRVLKHDHLVLPLQVIIQLQQSLKHASLHNTLSMVGFDFLHILHHQFIHVLSDSVQVFEVASWGNNRVERECLSDCALLNCLFLSFAL